MTTITERASFNLLDQPWIPVTLVGGQVCSVSLLDIARSAKDYLSIGHSDPLIAVAVHRLVLAFLHRALDGPKSAREAGIWYERGFSQERIDGYFTKWRDRFDLFDAERPFLQQPGIEREAFRDHWTRLSAARGSFNTNVLFKPELRTKDGPEGDISAAEAALELLGHQCFTLGGLIKRFVTSAKGSPVATSALTLVVGRNLHETLCLNMVVYGERHARRDAPVWERELPSIASLEKASEFAINGLTANYVWPARAVLLQPDVDGRVKNIYYAAGLPPFADRYPDPMQTTVKNSKGEDYPMSFREGKAMWRDLHSFVPKPHEKSGPEVIEHATGVLNGLGYFETHLHLSFAVFGMVNNKAKIALVRQENLKLPAAVVSRPELAEKLESWVREADSGAFRLKVGLQVLAKALISYGENAAPQEISAQVNAFQFEGRYWPLAEREFWAFVDRLSPDPEIFEDLYDEKVASWTKTVNRLVHQIYDEIAQSLGRSARTLRAVERGRLNLRKGFKGKNRDNNSD
jgi:CRISPR system Cascade subunit CasA